MPDQSSTWTIEVSHVSPTPWWAQWLALRCRDIRCSTVTLLPSLELRIFLDRGDSVELRGHAGLVDSAEGSSDSDDDAEQAEKRVAIGATTPADRLPEAEQAKTVTATKATVQCLDCGSDFTAEQCHKDADAVKVRVGGHSSAPHSNNSKTLYSTLQISKKF